MIYSICRTVNTHLQLRAAAASQPFSRTIQYRTSPGRHCAMADSACMHACMLDGMLRTVQYSTVQYSTLQYVAAHLSTVQDGPPHSELTGVILLVADWSPPLSLETP